MFWINPYSQRNQRQRWIWPLEEAKAQEAAERQALQCKFIELPRELDELKREIAARQQERKYEGQPRDHGRYSFGKMPKLVSQPAAMRRGGPRAPATPAQQARLVIANARAREAVARLRQLDPNWPAPQSLTSADNSTDYESMIRAKEAETREAEAHFIALSNVGRDGPSVRREPSTMDNVVMPGGQAVGFRTPGAGEKIRTVMPAEFENIRQELMARARRIDADSDYQGAWYKRQDGSIFGLRLSADHGLTLDVIQRNDPIIPRGLRIHQR